MIERSFLQELKIPNEKSKYELVKEKHSHVLCKACNKVEDISLSIEDIIKEATRKTKYTINENELILSGICPDCQLNTCSSSTKAIKLPSKTSFSPT